MDKGAARSKKRAEQLERAAQKALEAQQLARQAAKSAKSKASSSTRPSAEAGPSKPRGRHLQEKKQRPVPEAQSKDPELYRPKAVRGAQALSWPCDLPPASLDGITRVDLTNSGVTNVEWLRGSGVRWLGLSGCDIQDWSPVGSLTELTGALVRYSMIIELTSGFEHQRVRSETLADGAKGFEQA
jgi:hypothetical protein